MSAAVVQPGPLGGLDAVLAGLPGGARARARRAAALARLLALGLPTRADGAWKHFNLRLLERRALAPPAAHGALADPLAALPPCDGPVLVFADGRIAGAVPALPDGVGFEPLAALLERDLPEDLEARLGARDTSDERVRLLNASLAVDGGHLTVAAGREVGPAVHVVHAATAAGGHYPRLLVSLAPGASLTLVEYHTGPADAASVAAPVVDVELAAGARLEHYSVGLAGPAAIVLEDASVRLAADARYRHRHLAFGARLARLDLRVRLEGPGASCALAGLLVADGSRELDVRTLVEHVAPGAKSDQVYRGVATDRGRGSYHGKVVVHAGAARSDSRQSSRNLLLSPGAAIDTRPELEINADDVKCSHGATTGALDEQMLFYLLARGIDREAARALLTFAFAGEVVGGIGLPALRRHAEARLLGSLPAAALIREFVR
jgi:Fe-S cluster assembly protein SufD